MKQTKRRILAWLMTVVLVLSVVTVLTPRGGRGGCGNRSFDTWKAGSQGYTAGR